MKINFAIAALAFLPCIVVAMDAKTVCDQLQPVVTELRTQLPQDIDYMTKLTGVQAMYINGNCLLNYNYLVSTAHFLKEMADGNKLSDDENLALLQTEDGKNAVKSAFTDIANNAAVAHFAVFKNIPKVKITYQHIFDNSKIPPQVSVLIDNTL